MTCTGANLSLQNQVEIQHTTHANQSSGQNSKLLQAHILTCHQIQVPSQYMISVYLTLVKTRTELNNRDSWMAKTNGIKINLSWANRKKTLPHCMYTAVVQQCTSKLNSALAAAKTWDLKSQMKEEALHSTVLRTWFGRGYGLVVRQTTKWMLKTN